MSLSRLGRRQISPAGKQNDTRITTLTATLRGSSDGSYGAWVQLLESAAYDTFVLRLTHHPTSYASSGSVTSMYALVGLGTGAAGSEVQKAEILLSGTMYYSGLGTVMCGGAEINPWFSISAGTRLSARLSIPGAEVQQTVRFSTIASHYLSEV